MKEDEMKTNILSVKVTPKEEINPEEVASLIDFYKAGYGDRWLGEENFRNVMMQIGTQLVQIYSEGRLAAAAFFDHSRICDISVHPDFTGQGLGVKLIQEAAVAQPDAWISIGIDADGMLATITDDKLNFLPVEDKDQIEQLFRNTNRGKDNFEVGVEQVEVPIVTKRLAAKGIIKDKFTAFYRHGATHGQVYKQLLFQNKP